MNTARVFMGERLSSGTAEGVVATLDGEGGIFVAERATPLDSLKVVNARGIIVEEGGTLSHIAIYARELGIPCIRLPNATELIPAGSRAKIPRVFDEVPEKGPAGFPKYDKKLMERLRTGTRRYVFRLLAGITG